MYKITVIMGVYNCEKTLDEAIESLLTQTCDSWKLVMCDDGSSDGTYALAKSYADRYENIIVVQNEKNLGLNATLNHCLEYADTEYVARMDGDDISLPRRFEKELAFLESNPEYDIVSGNMIYFDEEGDWAEGKSVEKPQKIDFVRGTPFCHAPCMVRRSAYERVGGYSVEEKLLRVEDYHLWYKMYLAGSKGYNLQEAIYKMRDDRAAIGRRRKYKYRVNEARVKKMIIRDFKLPFRCRIHILRPLIVGLLPTWLYKKLHRNR